MTEKLFTLTQAAKKKGVTRQAIDSWLRDDARLQRCQEIPGNIPGRAVLRLIPASLLVEYNPSAKHKESGKYPKNTQ